MAAKARLTEQGFNQIADDMELLVVAGPDDQGMFICVPASTPILLAADEFAVLDSEGLAESVERHPSGEAAPAAEEPALPEGVEFKPRMVVAPCGAPGPRGLAFDGITCELPDHGEGSHRAFAANHPDRQWADDLTWKPEASRKV